MNTKHTFWTLCNTYAKIEVPIIQRDYAQGRETDDVKKLRKKFIKDFLIQSLIDDEPIELDFVYGSVVTADRLNEVEEIFIPLDGQQRLTTLFLLHWFIAQKEQKMVIAAPVLSKFTYETRPSAHSFCANLITRNQKYNLKNIRQEILDSEWYDNQWSMDPTVDGMLNMLETFSKSTELLNTDGLFERLVDIKDSLISFYFISLEKFGLTENLYIRMNARGKILSPFENFKSEIYKVIGSHDTLVKEVKDKIEYKWVDNLWQYREANSYVIDKPFVRFFSFITEMLYFKRAKFRDTSYESDFTDFQLIKKIYTDEENIKFFIFSFDILKKLQLLSTEDFLWKQKTSIKDILNDVIEDKADTTKLIILYSVLTYLYLIKNETNLNDFVRVIRNLLENTPDNSRREWPKLLQSISNLISINNIYDELLEKNKFEQLDGFNVPQRNEEIFKAKLIQSNPLSKVSLFEAEDNFYLRGNITSIIKSNYAKNELEFETLEIKDLDPTNFDLMQFKSTYNGYKKVSEDDFNNVWGHLINSRLYVQAGYGMSRLQYDVNHTKNVSVLMLSKEFGSKITKKSLKEFLYERDKKYIKLYLKSNPDLTQVRNVKIQLSLYFLIHTHIENRTFKAFFKNGFNFGWLKKEKGFMSLFSNGIEHDELYKKANPIFQTYNYQFRYSFGLKQENSLDTEVVGSKKKKNAFRLLEEWSK